MFYYLYEIRNTINNKIYVGVHKTTNIDDGYMGSGKVIKNAIKKYGIENFEKNILEMFADDSAMYMREKEVVTDEFLERDDVYNLLRGGLGGFDHINKNATVEMKKFAGNKGAVITNSKYANDADLRHIRSMKLSAKNSKLHSLGVLKSTFLEDKSVQHKAVEASKSPEAIAKRKDTYKKTSHQSGEKNSQFGTMWITDGITNRKITKGDDVPAGWEKGRAKKI